MQRPYRHTLTAPSPEALERENGREGRTAGNRYLPAGEEIRAMDRGEKERLPVWVTHPDERVLHHLIATRYAWIEEDHRASLCMVPGVQTYQWGGLKRPLLSRIFGAAEQEGIGWSPLIDRAIATDWMANQSTSRDCLARLRPWIESRTDAADLLDLWRFEERHLRAAVAQLAPVLDRASVHQMLRHHEHELWVMDLCQNSALTPEVSAHVARLLLRFLKRQARKYGGHLTTGTGDGYGVAGIAALVRAGHPVDAEVVAGVSALYPTQSQDGENLHPSKWWLDRWLEEFRDARATAAQLHAIRPLVRARGRLDELATHPAADLPIWREALATSRSLRLRVHIARQGEARRDPEIRQLLLKSRAPKVVAAMALEGDPTITVPALRRLLPEHPGLVAEVLEQVGPEALVGLTRLDLAPLFQHPSARIRTLAIATLGRLGLHVQPQPRAPVRARR